MGLVCVRRTVVAERCDEGGNYDDVGDGDRRPIDQNRHEALPPRGKGLIERGVNLPTRIWLRPACWSEAVTRWWSVTGWWPVTGWWSITRWILPKSARPGPGRC